MTDGHHEKEPTQQAESKPNRLPASEPSVAKNYRNRNINFAAACTVVIALASLVVSLLAYLETRSSTQDQRIQDQHMQAIGTGVYFLLYHVGNAALTVRARGHDDELMESFYETTQLYVQSLEKDLQEGFSLGLLQDMAGKHEEAPAELSLLLVHLNILSTRNMSGSDFLEYFRAPETICSLVRLAYQCTQYRKQLFEGYFVRRFITRMIDGVRRNPDCKIR